jgi:8-oxo-dGTP diphosphatase
MMLTDNFLDRIQASKTGEQPEQDTLLAQYETPLVTVDIVLFTADADQLQVLLIQRKSQPFQHMWAIPGGFIRTGETLEEAAKRRLLEETNIKGIYLEQLSAFGTPERDPRARVITVAYYALIGADRLKLEASANAEDVRWFSITQLPELAFDHRNIVQRAWERMKTRLKDSNISFQLLPERFTLTELQRVYELILDRKLDKRNFRKKMLSLDILAQTDQTKMEGYHRPAQLYAFKEREKVLMYELQ